VIENMRGVCRGVRELQLDDTALPPDAFVPLTDGGGDHRVRVVLG
jgi:hypothetical protein